MTRHELQARFAATVNAAASVNVEATNRTESGWTISGSPADVDTASAWLVRNVGMVLDSIEYDAELDESFAYMTAA